MVITRRSFLGTSATLALSAASYSRAADSPNEKIRLAVMGLRTRGKQLIPGFKSASGVEIACLIEPDDAMVKPSRDLVPDAKVEKDVRKVLEDKSITALVVSMPDHWHALATIWACQAGKHVYVEKPVSHNLIEGRKMIEAARRNKVIVQAGTQRRSASHVHAARDYIASGKLGKTPFARTWIAGSRKSIGKKADAPVPAGVDYDLWLGPAPARPFNPNRFHYNWHWFWEYGTGELGNNGIHGLDMARAVLNLDAPRITSAGGKYVFDDDQQTPDTQTATFEFPGCTLMWEHRVWEKSGPEGESFGLAIHGEKGTMLFDGKGWHIRDGDGTSMPNGPDMVKTHQHNFIDCIRTGKTPNADIEEGHKSTRLCHLGNIAFRTGRAIRFEASNESIPGDKEATQLLGREYRKGFEVG